MLRIIHTADIHLGAHPDAGFPWAKDREKGIRDAFIRILQTAYEEKTDILIIAGDLFHYPPGLDQIREVNRLFGLIPETAVVLCAGNHDYINAAELYKKFKWNTNVYGLWTREVSSVVIPDKDVRVYGCSYYSKTEEYDLYEDAAVTGDEKYHILVAHGGDAKHSPLNTEALKASEFDYIALGHIHKPGSLIKDKAVYSGGPEPLDKTEKGKRGFVKVVLEKGMKNRVSFVRSSECTYETIELKAVPGMTEDDMKAFIAKEVAEKGEASTYTLHITGRHAPDQKITPERLWQIGHFIEVTDDSVLDIDAEELLKKYPGSLLSAYIRSFEGCEKPEEKYALEAGIRAILSAKERLS